MLPAGDERSLRHDPAWKGGLLPRRRVGGRVEHSVRPSNTRARPRPLPASAADRPRRFWLRLARARRANRPRGRTEDRSPRGQARVARGAGDGGCIAPSARTLRPRLRLRRRQRPRLHRLRVRPGTDDARGAPRAASSATGRRSKRRPRSSTLLLTLIDSGSSTGTSSRRTCSSKKGPELSIRLLDFGLAQFDEADTLTAVGDVPGTLAYIAPERLTGGDATTASDVWAVGVLLWESLAGEHPFWGVPLPQVAAAIESGAPPLAEIRADLPPAVADAVSSALTVDPAGARRPSGSPPIFELPSRRLAGTGRARPASARPLPRRRRSPLRSLSNSGSFPRASLP